ncbi:MAG: DUF2318 domain-containing protein [Thermodesulfovibrionales bacterium]|nr:DUF2318 domain-containing protein [Thermodesulfovibrionales bacterium]
MSLFISEAFAVGIKEGFKLWLVWLVFSSLLKEQDRPGLMRPFYLGLALTSMLFAASFLAAPGQQARGLLVGLTGYTFFIFFLSSALALYQGAGVNLFGPLRLTNRHLLRAVITASTVFYFSPDIIGSSMFVRDAAEMKASYAGVYLSAASGFILPLIFIFTPVQARAGRLVSGYFGLPQFLLFLSVIKLLGGGIKGFAEFSLMPLVQAGLMKFFHDVVHQTFVYLMVPDHPMLNTTAWNFVGIFFGSNISIAATLLLLLIPPSVFLHQSFLAPVPEPGGGAATGAERRMFKSSVVADRRRKAVPVIFFMAFILISWYSGAGDTASRLYNPKPKPVVEDKGQVVIPFTDPTMDLLDGRLHKFSLVSGQEAISIIVIKKPDGGLAVCLDACEICSPEGYGQTEGKVVCIYCMTPIPVSTLGRPGGCNPIPLNAIITERDLRIDVAEILLKWKDVKTGKTKGAAE